MDDADNVADDILNQLKSLPKIEKKANESGILKKDDVDAFILKYASKLITDSSVFIDNITDGIQSSGDAESITAFADLVKATSGAIEILNKISLAGQKNKTLLELKKIDVESRSKENNKLIGAALLTREEIMKKLFKDADVIDAEYKEVEALEDIHNDQPEDHTNTDTVKDIKEIEKLEQN